MVAKRLRKVKRGRASAEAAATASEWGQNLPTRYEGVVEADPSNYILLPFGEKFGADKNGGDRWVTDGSGGGGRAILDQRNNLTRFMMNGKLAASGADMAAKKAASNRGGGGRRITNQYIKNF